MILNSCHTAAHKKLIRWYFNDTMQWMTVLICLIHRSRGDCVFLCSRPAPPLPHLPLNTMCTVIFQRSRGFHSTLVFTIPDVSRPTCSLFWRFLFASSVHLYDPCQNLLVGFDIMYRGQSNVIMNLQKRTHSHLPHLHACVGCSHNWCEPSLQHPYCTTACGLLSAAANLNS